MSISDYYLLARPGVRAFGLDLGDIGEQIDAQTYLDSIRAPLLSYLDAQSWGNDIDTFVTTKGLPLRIDAGAQPPDDTSPNWYRYSSLESELTRVDSISSTGQMGDQHWTLGLLNIPNVLPANPYYLGSEFDPIGNPIPYAGPQGFDRSNPTLENIRLTSRLDGFSTQDVFDMIDRSVDPIQVSRSGDYILLDDDPTVAAANEDRMPNLAFDIAPQHSQWVGYDDTNAHWTTSPGPVIGYVSHGTKSGLAQTVPGELDSTGYINTELAFQTAPGAILHTYESFNAFTFDPNSTAPQATQGLAGQWIAQGGTAALGHVQEPFASVNTITNEDIFFDMMLSGYTLAESVWASTRQLSYVNTAIGDPLLVWEEEPEGLQGDTNGDGVVEFIDFYTLQGNWMTAGDLEDGDFTGDGFVDQQDYQILQDNWLQMENSNTSVQAISQVLIETVPVADPNSGWPQLSATLVNPANLNGDLNVDGDDLEIFTNAYGKDASGDIDGDGDTDGVDFLTWQRNVYRYTLTADKDFSGQVDGEDLNIWEDSYGKNLGGDTNADGVTDGRDFLAMQREFVLQPKTESVVHSATTTTPEPSSMVTLMMALFTLGCRCRSSLARPRSLS